MIIDGLGNKTFEITSFLMVGQSNMAGRGNLDEVEPIKNDNLYMLRMGRWQRHADKMNAIFHEIAKEMPHCAVASAEGITIKKSDGLHFDSKGSREFGHRYFQKYLEIVK